MAFLLTIPGIVAAVSIVGTAVSVVSQVSAAQEAKHAAAQQQAQATLIALQTRRAAQAAANRTEGIAAATAAMITENANLTRQQATEVEAQAGQERAAAQLAAIDQIRQGRLIKSRAQAVAAASGAGALDPTIIDNLGQLDTEIDIRAQSAMFEGYSKGAVLDLNADSLKAQAQQFDAQSALTIQEGKANAANILDTGDLNAAQINYSAQDTVDKANQFAASSYASAAGTAVSGITSSYDIYQKYKDRGGK